MKTCDIDVIQITDIVKKCSRYLVVQAECLESWASADINLNDQPAKVDSLDNK